MKHSKYTCMLLFPMLAALTALICGSSSAFGLPAVKNVTTGTDYPSIAEAVSAVRTGEVIELLESSSYQAEEVNIAVANVTLRAASGTTPTLRGNYKDHALLVTADGVSVSGIAFTDCANYAMKVENASDVTLSGLSFNGWFAKNGLYAVSAARLNLSNITFENCGEAGISLNSSASVTGTGLSTTRVSSSPCKTAIEIVSCEGAALSSLNVSTMWSDVIVVNGSSRTTLSNLTVYGGDRGIVVNNSPGTAITSCTTSGLWGGDIYVRNSTGFSLTGSMIQADNVGLKIDNSRDASVFNTTFAEGRHPSTGIRANGVTDLRVRRVTIDGNFYCSGIYTKTCNGADIRNTIIRNAVMGISLDSDSENISIVNNTIAFNQSSGIYIASGCGNTNIRNNIIVSNGWSNWTWGIQCQSTDHPGLSITYNDVWNNRLDYQNCSAGHGDISADPLFTSPPLDLHETRESPCVDAGDPSDPVGDEPSPNGGRINQGAYGGTSEAATSPDKITVSLPTAACNGWIGLYCYVWDGIEYIPVSAYDTTLLPAWTGFWVEVKRNLDILFPPSIGQPAPPSTMSFMVDPLRYYLITSPLLPSNGDQSAVFGDDIGGAPETEWRVSKYNYLTESFQRYTGTGSIPGVIPGRGFWLYVNLDTQKTLNVTGSPVSQSTDYALKLLSNGSRWTYHMIGNPFPYDFRWGDVKIRVPVTPGLELGKPAASLLDETDAWHIGLELSDAKGRYRDTNNRAGAIENGPDYHSVLSAPDLGSVSSEYIRLALRDPKSAERKLLAYDYRRPGMNEYRWEIEISSTVDETDVSFRLTNIASVPKHYRVTLIDDHTETVREIGADSVLPVTLKSGQTLYYTLVATDLQPMGVQSAVPAQFGITGTSPNPFNPATDISFSLDRPGDVRIAVYSLTGQLVATPAEGFMPAGKRTIRWNAAGCASGVYIVSLESQGRRDNRKITFLK